MQSGNWRGNCATSTSNWLPFGSVNLENQYAEDTFVRTTAFAFSTLSENLTHILDPSLFLFGVCRAVCLVVGGATVSGSSGKVARSPRSKHGVRVSPTTAGLRQLYVLHATQEKQEIESGGRNVVTVRVMQTAQAIISSSLQVTQIKQTQVL